jgi:hypothetical protein
LHYYALTKNIAGRGKLYQLCDDIALLESFDLTKLGLKGRARKIDFNQKSGYGTPAATGRRQQRR